MSSKITFSLDASTVEINAPSQNGTDVSLGANWVTALSGGLQRWSFRTTQNHLETWSISPADLTRDQWIAFQDFFYKVAKGPTNAFTYTHTDGAVYAARFVDCGLSAHRESDKLWQTSFKIEILGQQVNGTSTSTTSTSTTYWAIPTGPTTSTTSTAKPTTSTTTTPIFRTSTTTPAPGTTSTTTTAGSTTTTTTTTSTTTTCPSGSCTYEFRVTPSLHWQQTASTCGGGCSCPNPPSLTGFESDGDIINSNCYAGFHQL